MSLPARAVWWNHGAQIAEGDKYSLVEDHEGRWDSFFGYREGETVELSNQDGWIGQILFIQYGTKSCTVGQEMTFVTGSFFDRLFWSICTSGSYARAKVSR